jgi:hypothetical protein
MEGNIWLSLTLFPTVYFFCVSHVGVESNPSIENPLWFIWAQFLYNHLYIYRQVSIFKTLEMRCAQSSAVNLMNTSKIKNIRLTLSDRCQKLTEAPRMFFSSKDRDGHTFKVRQSWDPLNKHHLEHFEKLARGEDFIIQGRSNCHSPTTTST